MKSLTILAALLITCGVLAQTPVGEMKGLALVHTSDSARLAVANGALVLPSSVTGSAVYTGAWKDAPTSLLGKAPVVVFLHGSSGLGLKAIGEWQVWLAGLGIASFAPDSFALPDRLTYKSPIGKDVYEKIHALRTTEIELATQAVKNAAWADTGRIVLAGTSEGAAAVARYKPQTGQDIYAARIVYSWSCEDNYFVQSHQTALPQDRPVLNVMSTTDPFFSPSNPWLGNPQAKGHCAEALKASKQATIVLIPGAPHTLINLPAARHATAGFLRDLVK